MNRPHRLLSISHSYVVTVNRRLAWELDRQGRGRWELTAVSPRYLHTYLRPVSYEEDGALPYRMEILDLYFSRWVHIMCYDSRLKGILSEPWDLVYSWEEPFTLVGAQVASWTKPGVPLVFRTYQNIVKDYPFPFSWMERYCLRRSKAWIAAGKTVEATVLQKSAYGAKPHRFIPDGVDLQRFCKNPASRVAVRARLGWQEPGPPVIGFLARFVPEKGLPLLMRVLDLLKTPWRCLFVGEGRLEKDLRLWAWRHGDRVRVVTGVRHSQVPEYLNAMDFLCVLSQTTPTWREQFGRMLVEAFACELPVVASDSAEIPHVVGDAAIIVGEKDFEGWVAAISDLLENPERREDLARRGLDVARRRYDWPVVARQHLDFFEQLLDSGVQS